MPGRYSQINRDDKVVAIKNKIIKLENVNRVTQLAHKRLVSSVGIINLSESDIEDDLIELMPVVIANEPLPMVVLVQDDEAIPDAMDVQIDEPIPEAAVVQNNNESDNVLNVDIGNPDQNTEPVPMVVAVQENEPIIDAVDVQIGKPIPEAAVAQNDNLSGNVPNAGTGNNLAVPGSSTSVQRSIFTDEIAGPLYPFKHGVSIYLKFN